MNSMVLLIIFISLAVICVLLGILYSRGRSLLDKRKIARMIAQGALVVDVREKPMYNHQHYPQAINIPESVFFYHLQQLGAKDNSIIIYCSSGYRSEKIVKKLKSFGYTNVVNGFSLRNLPSVY